MIGNRSLISVESLSAPSEDPIILEYEGKDGEIIREEHEVYPYPTALFIAVAESI